MEIWFSCDELGGEWTTGFGTSASGGSSIGCRSPGSDTSSDAGAAVMSAGDTNVGIVSVLITGDSVGFLVADALTLRSLDGMYSALQAGQIYVQLLRFIGLSCFLTDSWVS